MLLTGTPLQNNVEELYSLLSFLEPKQFASSEAFMAEFGKLESEAQVDKLKAVSLNFVDSDCHERDQQCSELDADDSVDLKQSCRTSTLAVLIKFTPG